VPSPLGSRRCLTNTPELSERRNDTVLSVLAPMRWRLVRSCATPLARDEHSRSRLFDTELLSRLES
jgi:hypothetical protein